ncbi:hypothetical protein HZB02_01935 [Candidatus Woesearchaeota archaeon]|nr:hypothetical protein [Candidatus Woesearchaeota archaeon]
MAKKKVMNNTLYLYAFIALVVGVVLGVLLSGSGLTQGKAIAQPTLRYNLAKTYLSQGGRFSPGVGLMTHTPPFTTDVSVYCPSGTSLVVYGGCGEQGMFYFGIPMYLMQSRPIEQGQGWYCQYAVADTFPPEMGYNAFNNTYIAAHVYCK